MPSITSWNRLVGRSREPDTTQTISGEVRDPLWFLARQWQFGEFTGCDGGSPIQASTWLESAPISRFRVGTETGDLGARPIAAIAEREDPRAGPAALGLAFESGLQLLRILDGVDPSLRARALAAFPLARTATGSDPYVTADRQAVFIGDDPLLLRAAYGAVPDGAAAFAALSLDPLAPLNGDGGLAGDLAAQTRAAVVTWLAWYGDDAVSGSNAWVEPNLEYRFAMGAAFADGPVTLVASADKGTGIDWSSFDVSSDALGASAAGVQRQRSAIPSPIRFRGSSVGRCWEFEDGGIDFGNVEATPLDLPRLLLLDFAFLASHQWFVVPLAGLAASSLTRVQAMIVTDTFGMRSPIEPVATYGGPSFAPGALEGTVLVPPAPLHVLEGPAREDVLFFRDEGAYCAWAVERVVEGPGGAAISREHEAFTASAGPSSTPDRYLLATSVPRHWIPLVPSRPPARVELRRGTVLPPTATDGTLALGQILSNPAFYVFDEEVPREGVRVTRSYRFARNPDGTGTLWLARTVRVGQGEGASHLEYDVIWSRRA